MIDMCREPFGAWLMDVLMDERFQVGERIDRDLEFFEHHGGFSEENRKKLRACGIDWEVAGGRIYVWQRTPP